MKKDVLDLRFIIGLFFGLTGIILILESIFAETTMEKSEETNMWSGIVYVLFSLLMLILWTKGQKKEALKDTDSVSEGQ